MAVRAGDAVRRRRTARVPRTALHVLHRAVLEQTFRRSAVSPGRREAAHGPACGRARDDRARLYADVHPKGIWRRGPAQGALLHPLPALHALRRPVLRADHHGARQHRHHANFARAQSGPAAREGGFAGVPRKSLGNLKSQIRNHPDPPHARLAGSVESEDRLHRARRKGEKPDRQKADVAGRCQRLSPAIHGCRPRRVAVGSFQFQI